MTPEWPLLHSHSPILPEPWRSRGSPWGQHRAPTALGQLRLPAEEGKAWAYYHATTESLEEFHRFLISMGELPAHLLEELSAYGDRWGSANGLALTGMRGSSGSLQRELALKVGGSARSGEGWGRRWGNSPRGLTFQRRPCSSRARPSSEPQAPAARPV